MSQPPFTSDARIVTEFVLPLISEHGAERGKQIMDAALQGVNAIREVSVLWPADIAADAIKTLLHLLNLSMQLVSEEEKQEPAKP